MMIGYIHYGGNMINEINKKCKFFGGDRMGDEFKYIEKWTKNDQGFFRHGIDVGCGTNRLSAGVLAIDKNADKRYAHSNIAHDCKDLEIGTYIFGTEEFKFLDGELDFIFSSHCLEDFDNIPKVFLNWWKKLKVDGLMILLLPDMEVCDCEVCNTEAQKEYRKTAGMSARYQTLEDHKKNNKGNPSHRTNVGKKFMTAMLEDMKEKSKLKCEILQMDTIPHDKSCSVDFVIKKM